MLAPFALESQDGVSDTFELIVERSELDCTQGLNRARLECDWTASYSLMPEAGQVSQRLQLVFAVGRNRDPRVVVDGSVVPTRALGPEELASTPALPAGPNDAALRWVEVSAKAGQKISITIDGSVALETDICSCEGPGVDGRHPVVPQPESFHAALSLFVAAPSPAKIVVSHERTVRVHEEHRIDAGKNRGEGRMDASSPASNGAWSRTRVELVRDVKALPGGPVLGLGLGLDPAPAFRMRVGWEAAAPVWLAHSLAVESDARRHAELVYDLQAVSPHGLLLGILPSAGIGVGLPVQILPVARPGVRAATSLAWGPVHFYGSFDYFPALASSEVLLRGGILLGGSI